MTATRGPDATHVADLTEYADHADALAAVLADPLTVTVIGTGGNCAAILVHDDRPGRHFYDVLIVKNPDPDAPAAAAWLACPEQDAENISAAPGSYAALIGLDPGETCAYCGEGIDGSPCPARGDDGPHTTEHDHRARAAHALPDADWQPEPTA